MFFWYSNSIVINEFYPHKPSAVNHFINDTPHSSLSVKFYNNFTPQTEDLLAFPVRNTAEEKEKNVEHTR